MKLILNIGRNIESLEQDISKNPAITRSASGEYECNTGAIQIDEKTAK